MLVQTTCMQSLLDFYTKREQKWVVSGPNQSPLELSMKQSDMLATEQLLESLRRLFPVGSCLLLLHYGG
jgi:hypothetical protein